MIVYSVKLASRLPSLSTHVFCNNYSSILLPTFLLNCKLLSLSLLHSSLVITYTAILFILFFFAVHAMTIVNNLYSYIWPSLHLISFSVIQISLLWLLASILQSCFNFTFPIWFSVSMNNLNIMSSLSYKLFLSPVLASTHFHSWIL